MREADRRAIIEYERLPERRASLARPPGTAGDLMTIDQALREFAFTSTSRAGTFISLYCSSLPRCR